MVMDTEGERSRGRRFGESVEKEVVGFEEGFGSWIG